MAFHPLGEATQAQIAIQQSPEKVEVQLPEIQWRTQDSQGEFWMARVDQGLLCFYHGLS